MTDGNARDASSFEPASRTKLTARDAHKFSSETLFDRIGRVVCAAECLPRKELYEAWEVARRARRRFRGGRVVDLACGHALVAYLMLLLDDTSPTAIAADTSLPPSAAKIGEAMVRAWPRLDGRVTVVSTAIADVPLFASDVVVSIHACGALTDEVLTRATNAKARVVVLPCCHEKATCDRGGVDGWLDVSLAIDVTRAARVRARDYRVYTQQIPEAITKKNRLLMAEPSHAPRPPETLT